jgi:peptidoglycan/xylan/chitin deacetylase (PgdA/CDA1 family)
VFKSTAARLLPRGLLVQRGSAHDDRVALTFDDGPDGRTREYLDLLDRLRVRATFFVLGEQCEPHRDGLLDIVARGHEVASHGFSHRRFPTLTRREIEIELRDTAKLLPPSPRRRPMVRPPQGAISLASLATCALAGYQTVHWSIDSDDCRTQDPARVIAAVAPTRVQAGDIVLLHENQSWTLEALPSIVDGLRQAGLEFATVGEIVDG